MKNTHQKDEVASLMANVKSQNRQKHSGTEQGTTVYS